MIHTCIRPEIFTLFAAFRPVNDALVTTIVQNCNYVCRRPRQKKCIPPPPPSSAPSPQSIPGAGGTTAVSGHVISILRLHRGVFGLSLSGVPVYPVQTGRNHLGNRQLSPSCCSRICHPYVLKLVFLAAYMVQTGRKYLLVW